MVSRSKRASTVFFDPLSATGDDLDHSSDQRRFVTFGVSSSRRLLVVAHAEQDDHQRPESDTGGEEAL